MKLEDLQAIVAAMTKRPWSVWTSNSFRRITADGCQDGGVLRGMVQHHDNHPDLGGDNRDGDLAAIVALANHAEALVELARAVAAWRLIRQENLLMGIGVMEALASANRRKLTFVAARAVEDALTKLEAVPP